MPKMQHITLDIKNSGLSIEMKINLYNEIRLHLSLNYKTPNMVYLKTA